MWCEPITRRRALASIGLLLAVSSNASATTPQRVAIIDWGLLETALAIGAVPLAATELKQYRRIAVEPDVPHDVVDLGLRGEPSYELLQQLAPDLILISDFYEYQRAALARIAPVETLPVFRAGSPPYAICQQTTLALGKRLGRTTQARALVDETDAFLAGLRASVEAHASKRPMFVISLGDSRHFRAFGADSMFGDVIGRIGIANAWTDGTSYSAAAPVAIEALAKVPEASIAIIEPLPADVGRDLPRNRLWNALPAAREGRVAVLPPLNHFGALPSAARFARLLAATGALGAL